MLYGRRTDWTSLLVEAKIFSGQPLPPRNSKIYGTFQREVIVLENNEF
jgi:hypothetical protein